MKGKNIFYFHHFADELTKSECFAPNIGEKVDWALNSVPLSGPVLFPRSSKASSQIHIEWVQE